MWRWLFILLSIQCTNCANILFISAMASPSHHIWNNILAKGLVDKEYNVTMIGPEENIKNQNNYTYIALEYVYQNLKQEFNLNEMNDLDPLRALLVFEEWSRKSCEFQLKANGIEILMEYPSNFKFDLILIDLTIGPCFLPFVHRFNYPPTIGVTAFLLPPYLSFSFGNEISPSYQPHYGLIYDTNMSFLQRLWNFLLTYLDLVLKNKFQFNYARQTGNRVFGEDVPPLEELQRHVSLLLANTDPVLSIAQPISPNIIPVGGLHTRKSRKLPQEIQQLLDNAKSGIILFSLGTNVRSDQLDAKVQSALLEAFKERPEIIIWKFESDIQNLPTNVIVRKWLPQNDVLGHPNVKLFIGHGGALSTQEAIFHGVPMIAIPFFGDQLMNAKMVVTRKIGLKMEVNSITQKIVSNTLKEILSNPLYGNNMKKLSKGFRDRSETPLERGLYWIEYVLRNGEVPFLSPPSRNMEFYRAMNLDVISFLVVTFSALVYILYRIMKNVTKFIICRRKIKSE